MRSATSPIIAGLLLSLACGASPRLPATDPLAPAPVRAAPAAGAKADDCALAPEERRLLDLLRGDPEQRRPRLRCDATLQAFARARAADMAQEGYFGHVTPERRGPNALLKRFGYPLPPRYRGVLANNVESIAAGYAEAAAVWRELIASPGHRSHLLGEVPFYARQDEIGIAHVRAPGSDYGDYWVVVIARRAEPDEPRLLCMPEPGGCFRVGATAPD